MEEYSDIENDAFDATATMKGQEHEAMHQTQQQRGVEEERNGSVKLGVLKATSGNCWDNSHNSSKCGAYEPLYL